MKTRVLGSTGLEVSEVGFGAWAIGADWGAVGEGDAIEAVHAALDAGIDFFDTADVYGDGRSERILAKVRRERPDAEMVIATKAGRRLDPHVTERYTIENIERFVDRSLVNLEVEALDLVQLHCPPTEVYYRPELFEGLDDLKTRGKIRHYGVSVEKVEEAMKAILYPGVETVQIIFNVFRRRPADLFFEQAQARNVGILARVPLASGLLTGKMSVETTFAPDDHRRYNRHGEAFDVGETFAGVPFEVGLEAVERIRPLVPPGVTMAQVALRWILMFEAVSTVIPGAKSRAQSETNAAASALPPLEPAAMDALDQIYREMIAPYVHHRW